jgi:hypothetical protein
MGALLTTQLALATNFNKELTGRPAVPWQIIGVVVILVADDRSKTADDVRGPPVTEVPTFHRDG